MPFGRGDPLDPRPPLEVGIHGVQRPREWDATAIADAPELEGAAVRFVVLPDGSLLVEEQEGDASLAPLAEAVERTLAPPYRAEAVRRGGSRWAVGARAIRVVDLPSVPGDSAELTVVDGERTLLVDGSETFVGVVALEELAPRSADSYVVRADRLEGSSWEVQAAPL